MITREFTKTLLARLSKFEPLIQIILGPRQVGKTTAVKQVLEKFPSNSMYHSFDVPGLNPLETLRFIWENARKIRGHKILVLDEIQNVDNWAATVKELYDQDRPKKELSVALLGSSSLDLAMRGEESLHGRFEIIRATHWDLPETQAAFGHWDLEKYLQFGGYPVLSSIFNYQSEEDYSRCQLFVRDSILEPVISRDILSLKKSLNSALFRQTLQLSLTLPCEEISFTKILGQLNDRGNVTTIKSYLELMEKAFLIKLLYRYSGGQIRMRSSSPKIVPLAPALIHGFISPSKVKSDRAWFGKIFEAAIISRFNSLGYELYYWSNSKLDVDFIAKKNDRLIAFEVKSNSSADWRGLKAFNKEYESAQIVSIDRNVGEAFLSAPDPESFIAREFAKA